MSLERPVVVARGTPAEELADDGAAVAVDADPEALAVALDRLLDDTALRASLGARARAAVLSRHAVRSMAAAYESVYDMLVGAAE